MITFAKVIERFKLTPEFVHVIGLRREHKFSNDEAARILVLHEIHEQWPSISRDDLSKLFKQLEWAFKNPPNMTYDRVFAPGLRLQVIPKKYLMQIEINVV